MNWFFATTGIVLGIHGPRKSPGTCPPTTSRWVHVPHKNRAGYMSPAKLAPGTCPPTAGTRVPHATSQPTVLGTVLGHARPVSEQE
eukprot:780604-Prymnesium_polylepis.1